MTTLQPPIFNSGIDLEVLRLSPQRWFASEFVKPRIDRKPHKVAPKTVQEYLYDPRPIEQRLMTERHVQQLGENISDVSPTTYASWLQYFNSAFHQSLPWGNFFGRVSLSKSVKGCISSRLCSYCLRVRALRQCLNFPEKLLYRNKLGKGHH